MDSNNDKYSIKNILFSKAIPNYVIPVPTKGHRVYACSDCGDKFLLESSYQYHINRKSLKITFHCQYCCSVKVFYNRCNLLAHIRSHSFKTATINVTDLKVEPLPLNFFKKIAIPAASIVKVSKVTNKSDGIPKKSKIVHGVNKNIANSSTQAVKETQVTSKDIEKPNASVENQDTKSAQNSSSSTGPLKCVECDTEIPYSGAGRVKHYMLVRHYMEVTNVVLSCPVCLFTLPSICAFKAHLRFHFRIPPYVCPECGKHLEAKSTNYPYNHICDGFKMMRATARLRCPVEDCNIIHPNEFKNHLKDFHLKLVYKCPYCYVACFIESMMDKHLATHLTSSPSLPETPMIKFHQCQICPGKLVMPNQLNQHMKVHMQNVYVFPCWACGTILENVQCLIMHQLKAHGFQKEVKEWLEAIASIVSINKDPANKKNEKAKKIYRVVKRCDQCHRNFAYKCKFDQINLLPHECPYKCSAISGPRPILNKDSSSEIKLLTCHMCKNKITQNWEDIKKHFNEHHKNHRCLDVKIVIPRISIEKNSQCKDNGNGVLKTVIKKRIITKKRNRRRRNVNKCKGNLEEQIILASVSEFSCKRCGQECENKQSLEKHLVNHRDSCMAYQCLECGQCFVVKPSFSTHMLLEHNITNVDDYIKEKQCYNENALNKYEGQPNTNEPLRENQCKICRDQFENLSDLEKHFRVHGMAFLMKNNSKTASP